MTQASKRLDQQFTWPNNAEVLRGLREFTQALEARLTALDIVSTTVDDAIEEMRAIALTRINEVLEPAYEQVRQILESGFPSSFIQDASALGVSILTVADRSALLTILDLAIADIEGTGTVGRNVLAADGHADLANALALVVADVAGAAPLAGPTFTGIPKAPTPDVANNSSQIATTSFVRAVVAALVDSSPAALDTLKELAAALGNDPNFATTMTNALAGKAPLASPTFTGLVTVPANLTILPEGTEGGQLMLKRGTGSTISGDVVIDHLSNSLRIFETGGSARGVFLDITKGVAGATSELLHTGLTAPALSGTWAFSKLTAAGRQVYGSAVYSATAGVQAVPVGTYVPLCEVSTVALSTMALFFASARAQNLGTLADVAYKMEVFDISNGGNTLLKSNAKLCSAEPSRSGTAPFYNSMVVDNLTVGNSYRFRLSGTKAADNGNTLNIDDLKVEQVYL